VNYPFNVMGKFKTRWRLAIVPPTAGTCFQSLSDVG